MVGLVVHVGGDGWYRGLYRGGYRCRWVKVKRVRQRGESSETERALRAGVDLGFEPAKAAEREEEQAWLELHGGSRKRAREALLAAKQEEPQ